MGAAQGQKTPAGHAAVLQLLQTIGEAYSLLSKYHCQVCTLSPLANLCCSHHCTLTCDLHGEMPDMPAQKVLLTCPIAVNLFVCLVAMLKHATMGATV